MQLRLLAQLQEANLQLEQSLQIQATIDQPWSGSELSWQEWLRQHFVAATLSPHAPRHIRLWEWIESLRRGVRPRSFVAVWPRGGGKSTAVELGAGVRLAVTLERRFVLYVSETQAQANLHVQAIAGFLERIGMGRSINQYGVSRGWRSDLLRTENGFNVAAFGLDAGARGVKLDQYRPDLIVLDDVDGLHDTPETSEKKLLTITSTVLPAGSTDCGVLFVQNRVSEESLMSRLVDGEADWLADREPISEEPAIVGMAVENYTPAAGEPRRWRITAGTPTWLGQDLPACEGEINRIGLQAFQRECQHEVETATGHVFDVTQLRVVPVAPAGLRICEAWDLAATEGGGDYTCVARVGMRGLYPHVEAYVLDVEAGQWGTEKVRTKLKSRCVRLPRGAMLRIPQDPSQAGVFQRSQLGRDLAAHAPRFRLVTGRKALRARGLAECVNLGNVYFVAGPWLEEEIAGLRMEVWLKRVLRRFREDEKHEIDDPVDALADAFNELALYPDATPEERQRDRLTDQSWLPPALRTPTRQDRDGLLDFGDWDDDRNIVYD